MYDYKTQIAARLVDQVELEDLVGRLAKRLGAEWHLETVHVVSTDDADFSGMLDTLSERMAANGKSKKREGVVLKKRKQNVPTAEKKLGLHSYSLDETGEVISAQALNKRIAAHEIARGTRLTNGRGEKFEIIQGPEEGKFIVVKWNKVAEGEQA
jgi:hypothetical protein